jgi:hypothetical protein
MVRAACPGSSCSAATFWLFRLVPGMYSKYPVKHGRLRPVLYLSHAAALYGTITGDMYRFYRNKCTVSPDMLFRGLFIASSQKFILKPLEWLGTLTAGIWLKIQIWESHLLPLSVAPSPLPPAVRRGKKDQTIWPYHLFTWPRQRIRTVKRYLRMSIFWALILQ